MSLTGRDVVEPYVQQHADTVRGSLPLVLADVPDAIHVARVATRRLRSALKTYRPLWRSGHGRLRDELRWYASVLSRPRDLEVVGAWLEALLTEPEVRAMAGALSAADELRGRLRLDREDALTSMRTELAGKRFARLRAALPPADWSLAAEAPDPLLVSRLAAVPVRLAATQAASLPSGADRPAALHELRKTTKAVRYAVDALGPGAAEHAAVWKSVTETLGVAQDGQVAKGVLAELTIDAPAHRPVWNALSTMVDDAAAVAETAGLELVHDATTMPDARVTAG